MIDTYDAGYLPDDADCDQDTIRCELGYAHEFYSGIIQQLEDEIDEFEQSQPKWISVEDELPPHDTTVLCFTACRNTIVGGQLESEMYSGNRYVSWDLAFNHDVVITHWMPLPQPPEVSDDGCN